MDNLNDALVKLVLDNRTVLCEELWCLPESLKKAQQPSATELTMVREWWMIFLPWQADFISVSIKLDLLDKSFIH